MLGRGMPEINDALAEDDATGWAVGQISVDGWHLGSEAESVSRARARDLRQRSCLPGECLSDIIGGWRERPKLRVNLRKS